MAERRGIRGLELWCRRETEGYPGVNIVNMTTSWRNGLAFCALIHRFRPDLIEFSLLNESDVYKNNQLAFTIAERHLGIPSLLDPEDMVQLDVPDKLSILTYVSQFYRAFHVESEKSPSVLAKKRKSPHHFEHESTPSPSKVTQQHHIKPCNKCNFPVSLGDRLRIGKSLFHRTCFRCVHCNNLLIMENYQETQEGLFSCHKCPQDPEPPPDYETPFIGRCLSDEEKLNGLKMQLPRKPEASVGLSSFQQARLRFMAHELNNAKTETEVDKSAASCLVDVTKDSSSSDSDKHCIVLSSDLSSTEQQDSSSELVNKSPQNTTSAVTTFDTDSESVSLEKAQDLSSNLVEISVKIQSKEASDIPTSPDLEKCRAESKSDPVSNKIQPVPAARKRWAQKFQPKSSSTPIEIAPDKPSGSYESEASAEILHNSEENPDKSPEILHKNEEIQDKIEEIQENIVKPVLDIEENQQPRKESPDKTEASEDIHIISLDTTQESYPEDLNPFGDPEEEELVIPDSLNPFEGDEEEEDNKKEQDTAAEVQEKPMPSPRKKISAPKISLNPFWSDDSDLEDADIHKPPTNLLGESSSSSLSSLGGVKKKKPAPKPPAFSQTKTSPLGKKNRKAPSPPRIRIEDESWKMSKDEANKHRQLEKALHNVENQWRRSKGIAPAPPIPMKRPIKPMAVNEVRHELDMIEQQMQGLERQSLHLETIIRQQSEAPEVNPAESLAPESEDLILQLFDVVNEKNELFRRQSELMHLQKQQRLEEEHADIEYRIRCLMTPSEINKSDNDKLIESLMEQLTLIVDQRNAIVESLELDRRREIEEDSSITTKLKSYALDKEKEKNKVQEPAAGQEEPKKHKGKGKKGKKRDEASVERKVPYFLRSMNKGKK